VVLAGRTTLTDEEVAALKKRAGELFNGDGDAAFGDEIYRSLLESVKAGQSAPYRKAPDYDDPDTWTKPWSAIIPLRHSPDRLFEYACHEGNTGLEGILAGAREEERASQ
jgi:hypothetical protein